MDGEALNLQSPRREVVIVWYNNYSSHSRSTINTFSMGKEGDSAFRQVLNLATIWSIETNPVYSLFSLIIYHIVMVDDSLSDFVSRTRKVHSRGTSL